MRKKTTLAWTISVFICALMHAQTLQWEELGPAGIGGRTRAILVDKRDPTRSTVYAGMVSGGLWKSTDRGNTWHQLLSVYSCTAVSCIAQDTTGRIYFGTGEGLAEPEGTSRNSGSVGNGLHFLYGSDQDSILPSTAPAYLSNNLTWSMINRIAINPINPLDIYVATSSVPSAGNGLQHSLDGGQTWALIGSASAPIQNLSTNYGSAADVKFSSDGKYIFASIGLNQSFPGTNLIVSQDGGTSFSYVADTSFPGSIMRIEIGTAPSDPLTAYVSMAEIPGSFAGVWKTGDGGSTWTQIGTPTGMLSGVFGSDGQGWFDNSISVSPGGSGIVYLGGVSLYSYSDLSGWSLASEYTGGISDPHWVQPDMQTIVFNDLDSDEMYIGCDGGIFKSTNANSAFPTPTYAVSNNGYNTAQNYSVAADMSGNVLGSTQEAGTILVNLNRGQQVVYSGTGGYTEISHFDSSIFIAGMVEGQEYRSTDRGNTWNTMFDAVIDPYGYGEPSVCGQPRGAGNAPFVTAFWLAETQNATNSVLKVPFVDNVAHSAGDIVTLTSHIGQPFQETLTAALPSGDTVYFTDRLQSRLYLATSCGLWMTPGILNTTNIPHWFRITSSYDNVQSLAVSATGDTIYLGGDAQVTRISGLNSIPFDTFSLGQDSMNFSAYALYQMVTTSVAVTGRYVEGMDVDIHDPDHVVCTIAGFTAPGTPHVYVSTDAGGTWAPVGGNGLPDMPVYQCVIDAYSSSHYIIGSELGFWDSQDGGNTWIEQNAGIVVREPVYRLRQQNYLSDQCYALYAGTHGRGMWRCTTMTEAEGCTVVPLGISTSAQEQNTNNMLLYPNPMDGTGKVEIELAEASDVKLRILDISGRVLMETTYSHLNEGKNTLDLNASSLSDGPYLVVAQIGTGQTYTRTLVVAR